MINQVAPKSSISPFLNSKKLGFIGAGHMTSAVISGLTAIEKISPQKVLVASRSQDKVLALEAKHKIQACSSIDAVLDHADIVFLSVKPQDLGPLLENIGKSLDEHQIVVSFAAGYNLKLLRKYIPRAESIIRVMPTTAAKISQGILGYTFEKPEAQIKHEVMIKEILSVLGTPIFAPNEELFDASMVACSSGIGFILEFMQIWSEWLEEKGFSAEEASVMTSETFLATSMLARTSLESFAKLQNQVTSRKGVTGEGLESFRAMDLDRTLRIGFENALLRSAKLAQPV
jgi:pyrroline-5-carboxylate reductase